MSMAGMNMTRATQQAAAFCMLALAMTALPGASHAQGPMGLDSDEKRPAMFRATADKPVVSSCPAAQVVADGQGQPKTAAAAKDVTDVVITSIDLSHEPGQPRDRALRLRKLVVQPGGVVPWHSHGDRPAIITILSGEIVEYASTCKVAILHKAGESTTETHATSHWWRNETAAPVVLLSADLFNTKHADDHMM